MSNFIKSTIESVAAALAVAALLAIPATASAEAAKAEEEARARGMVMTMEAEVTAIDLETRQVSLKGPTGETVTVTARENLVKREDVSVGDVLVATYLVALEGELRAPTEEELKEPWLEMTEAGVSQDEDHPAIGEARIVRAVTTVEGMNRALGTVTLMDSNGKLHLIGDVEPEKMEGVTLGTTIVVIYREALALSLEHTGKAAE